MVIDVLKTYGGDCTCGKTHSLETEIMVVECDALKKANEYIEAYGIKGFTVAVYDENTYKATADRHPKVDAEVILSPDNLHANEHGVALLEQRLPKEAQVLIAVGSGTIHDITRYCAYTHNATFVSCPTAASVDGFCSSVAAMTWNGCKKTLTAVAPKIVIADTTIFQNAPFFLTRSGFGDMIGKFIALTDWKISNILKGEYYCDRIASLTKEATDEVLHSADGICNGDTKAYESLMRGLLLSGIAMQLLGNSRPASGAEHHISHIIEMSPAPLEVKSDALHGEKVGVGTLMAIKEYHRICDSTNIEFCDYKSRTTDELLEIFGEGMYLDIVKENQTDSGAGVTSEMLNSNWDKIVATVAALPTAEELEAIYVQLGMKRALSDIEVSEDKKDVLLECSPLVRNRLTLMRLRRCIK